MIGQPWLQIVLAVLALYHLGVGAASVLSFGAARRIAAIYGASIEHTPQLRYAVRMLGLHSLTLGALLTVAAIAPAGNQPIIFAVAGLQLARAASRVLFRRELQRDLAMPALRNAIAVGLLLAEAAVLLIAKPG